MEANSQPLSSPTSSSRRYTSDARDQAEEAGQTGEESPGAMPGEAGAASVAWTVCVRLSHIFSNHIDALFFHRGWGLRELPTFSARLHAARGRRAPKMCHSGRPVEMSAVCLHMFASALCLCSRGDRARFRWNLDSGRHCLRVSIARIDAATIGLPTRTAQAVSLALALKHMVSQSYPPDCPHCCLEWYAAKAAGHSETLFSLRGLQKVDRP